VTAATDLLERATGRDLVNDPAPPNTIDHGIEAV
jgi:hypothetical protein